MAASGERTSPAWSSLCLNGSSAPATGTRSWPGSGRAYSPARPDHALGPLRAKRAARRRRARALQRVLPDLPGSSTRARPRRAPPGSPGGIRRVLKRGEPHKVKKGHYVENQQDFDSHVARHFRWNFAANVMGHRLLHAGDELRLLGDHIALIDQHAYRLEAGHRAVTGHLQPGLPVCRSC